MPPLLVALLGSPRPQGACARLLNAFCRGTRGWQIRYVNLARLRVHPCQGCGSCLRTRVCQYRDDMLKLIHWLDQAHAVVLAAPVYFYGFPAQTKAVIDRCHPLWNDPYWQRRRRPGFLLATCGRNRLSEFAVLRREAKAFFNTIGCRVDRELLVPGLERKDSRLKLARAARQSRLLAVRGLEQ
jgi:multimeric flavodoxin WrbA